MACGSVTQVHKYARNVLTFYPVDLAGATNFYVTAKNSLSDADALAVFQISQSAGLLVLAGAPATNPLWGSAVYSGLTVTVTLDDDATSLLPVSVENLFFDIKGIDALGARVPAYEGHIFVVETTSRAL